MVTTMVQIETRENSGYPTTGRGTKITLPSGETLPYTKKAVINIEVDKAITADLTIHCGFKGQAAATFWIIDPRDGKQRAVKHVEFEDGTSWMGGPVEDQLRKIFMPLVSK